MFLTLSNSSSCMSQKNSLFIAFISQNMFLTLSDSHRRSPHHPSLNSLLSCILKVHSKMHVELVSGHALRNMFVLTEEKRQRRFMGGEQVCTYRLIRSLAFILRK